MLSQPEIINHSEGTELPLIAFLGDPLAEDVDIVGGKARSLNTLQNLVDVPDAFTLTTRAYREVLTFNDMHGAIERLDFFTDQFIRADILGTGTAADRWKARVVEQGRTVRSAIEAAEFPLQVRENLAEGYRRLSRMVEEDNPRVGVRSSGNVEDSPGASYAGLYSTFLNRVGEEEIEESARLCMGSQYTERAVDYRTRVRRDIVEAAYHDSMDLGEALRDIASCHAEAEIAVIVQHMVPAEKAGVIFSRDPTNGCPMVEIESAYGLGEGVVGNIINQPDRTIVDLFTRAVVGQDIGFKDVKVVYAPDGTQVLPTTEAEKNSFSLTIEEAGRLALDTKKIEDYYGVPLDIEFAFPQPGDGEDEVNAKFLQARPITTIPAKAGEVVVLERKNIPDEVREKATLIFEGGIEASPGVGSGILVIADSLEEAVRRVKGVKSSGQSVILVADLPTPLWDPVVTETEGIVTNGGGTTSHFSIVAREVGIPCLAATRNATESLRVFNGKPVTLDTAGLIYDGELPLEITGEDIIISEILDKPIETTVGFILAHPTEARKFYPLAALKENMEVSLLRIEFILDKIGVHPLALAEFDSGELQRKAEELGRAGDLEGLVKTTRLIEKIKKRVAPYGSGKEYYMRILSQGIAAIAAVFPNSPVKVRMTDYKTSEYQGLLGSEGYEEQESNPMMGVRGVYRYADSKNREVVMWELEAIKRTRQEMGYQNIHIMVPMVRDVLEITGIQPGEETMERDRLLEKSWHTEDEIETIIERFSTGGYRGILQLMEEAGLKPGQDGLEFGMMVETPTSASSLDLFLDTGKIDFVSIGSNDLTQFVLAVDRENPQLQTEPFFQEGNQAVVEMVKHVVQTCNERGVKIGICGQAPSKNPRFVEGLVEAGIDSIGVTADMWLKTYELVRRAEEEKRGKQGE
ncbi:hypothetical protein ISS86_00420 [Candidatus Microgenomates bacterium]|nr:hypothetical protein [Candidatus Microgenomates bacterium]